MPKPDTVLTWTSSDPRRLLSKQELFDYERRWVRSAKPPAPIRIGQTPEQHARWILDFAFADLSGLSGHALEAIVLSMEAFIGMHVVSRPGLKDRHGTRLLPMSVYSERQRRGLQKWLRLQLIRLIAEEDYVWTIEDMRVYRLIWGGRGVFNFPNPTRKAFLPMFRGRVGEVLLALGDHLRSCRECRRPFVARKRQEYCTPGCSQTRRTRTFRRKNPEKVRTTRRRSYERSQRKKFPRARIATRTT